MKKSVLLLLAAGIWVSADAQNDAQHAKPVPSGHTKPVSIRTMKHQGVKSPDAPSFYTQSVNDRDNNKKKGGLHPEAAGTIPCGSAANLYGILDANTTAVTVNQATSAIAFTHRVDETKLPKYGSGTYEISYSLDMGITWDTSKVMYSNAAGSANGTRYPNGVIYNPTGNTTFSNAYWVASGPYTTGTQTGNYFGWDSVSIGSMKLDSTNITNKFFGNGRPGVLPEEFVEYMSSSDNATVHSIGDGFYYNSANTGDTYTGASLNTGRFNPTNHNFDWTQTLIRPHFASDITSSSFDTIPQIFATTGTAWSQDGKTGYVVFFGNLDSMNGSTNYNFVSYQPIVYKSIDSGATWTMLPLHNWRNDTTLVQYLLPTADSANTVLPFWNLYDKEQGGDADYDLTVDANGNLHIFGDISGSTIAVPDSSNYIGYYLRGFLFDCHTTTPTGGWVARYIDTMVAQPSQLVNTGVWVSSGTGPLAMGHRIQATRTTDGSKVFVSWLDDYQGWSATAVDSMQYPDLFGQGYDVNTKIATPIKSFTFNQGLNNQTEQEYYICVSDLPYVTGTSFKTYHIPTVRVEAPATTNDGTSPVVFLYDTVNHYNDNDFSLTAGVQNIQASAFSITQNYPNPFNGITRFGINLTKESNVDVDVYNMVGQKMVSMSPERLGAGSHTITINGSGFATGVYFYRVTVDGSSLTQKMIVE